MVTGNGNTVISVSLSLSLSLSLYLSVSLLIFQTHFQRHVTHLLSEVATVPLLEQRDQPTMVFHHHVVISELVTKFTVIRFPRLRMSFSRTHSHVKPRLRSLLLREMTSQTVLQSKTFYSLPYTHLP